MNRPTEPLSPDKTAGNAVAQAISHARPRLRLWTWIAVAVAVVAAATYFAYRHLGAAPEPSAAPGRPGGRGVQGSSTPVVAVPARGGSLDVYLGGLGTVTPLETVTVRTRVDGQLMSVHFTEGQLVKAGDLLAQIDPRPFQVQLDQAQAQMLHDEALLANARTDLERYRTLLKQESIAEQQVATQESLVKQYQGTVMLDRAQIDNAKLQLTYARVTAPISGRLGLRLVDPGNVVHAADANGLVVITRLDPIAVVFSIPQDSLPAVLKRLGDGARIPVDAFGREDTTKLASGHLLAVDNQIDPATGTVKIKAEFDNQAGRLFPQQFVNVRMLIDTLHDAVLVPASAVQRGSQGTYVFVVKPDNTVTLRTLKLGPSEGELTAVLSGVAAGEKVVIDGTDRLREGAKVTPTTREAGPAGKSDNAPKTRGRRKPGGSGS
jgi:membrane fusion protein, multidrug efflux system